ncbi:RING-type domain-containing protein [Trichostrongylus colubriformis]|uniref:RING-type domain-containing protein n=1 Tax=Trichostrongylus colubriformis TaxID=6319 RepID=A0AAN8F2I2_TRICO
MSEEIVKYPEGENKPTHQTDTDIVATVDENASDNNSVKSTALVDLHACGICYQLYNDSERLPKVLSCGHTNCLTCLNSWQKYGSSPFPICAVCRKVTRRPINSLPNNFQLLQVLRRMKLISTDSDPNKAEEQQQSTAQIEEIAPGITAVCEQIDEHMNEVASLLESQLDRLSSMSQNEEHPCATEFDRLLRTVENASADLLSRWDMTKRHLLHTKKMKSRTSSSLPPFFNGYSGLTDFLGIGRVYDDVRTGTANDDPFDRIHDFLGLDSDTPPNAYSDFSLFGSETSHETAVSASEASSQENENFSPSIEPNPREESAFSHISTFDGTFGSYSYCSLCHCRLPTNHDSHQTHVLGRRHQYALGHRNDTSVTDAMRFLGLHTNRARQTRRPQTAPFSFARRFEDIMNSQQPASESRGDSDAYYDRSRSANHSNRPSYGRRRFHRNGRNTTRENPMAHPHSTDPHVTDTASPSARTTDAVSDLGSSRRFLPWNRGRTPERSNGETTRDRHWNRFASPSFGAAPSHRGNYAARRNNRVTLTGRTPLPTPHGGYQMPFLVLNEPNIGFLSGTGFFALNNSL